MVSCYIFDLDGTLFDTSEANVAAYSQAFKAVNLQFNADGYRQIFGLRFEEMMETLAPHTDPATRQQIKDYKAKFYQQNLDLVLPNHGLLSLLEGAQNKYKTALVTTARRQNVENLLAHFQVSADLFNLIITGEEVKHGKPDPECYNTAIARLGVKPHDCIIFEDSTVGIAAGQAAGCHVIKIVI